MKALLLTFVIPLMLISACKKEADQPTKKNDSISGYWIHPVFQDSIAQYDRSTSFIQDDYGFNIKSNGDFIEHKNAGWCGTPPVTYADFNGNWSMSDSTIHISVAYWGGTAEYSWKLISVDEQHLKVFISEIKYLQ